MSNAAIGYATYFGVLIGMLTFGVSLQQLHPQFGLIASQVVCLLVPALGVRYWTRSRTRQPAFDRIGLSPAGVVGLILTSALLGLAANSATGLLATLIPKLGEFAVAYDKMFESLLYPGDAGLRIAAVAAIVVVAPLCEETLFRSTILPLLVSPDRPLAATLLMNGLLFSLLHVNPVGFLALIVIGAFFAHVALLTKSIWPAMLAHATLNLVNGVFLPELSRGWGVASEPDVLDYVLAVGITVPLVALLWFVGARHLSARGSNA